MIGIDLMKRQTQIDSIGGKKGWEEGFTFDDGMKNLEKELLGFSSFFQFFKKVKLNLNKLKKQ